MLELPSCGQVEQRDLFDIGIWLLGAVAGGKP